VTALVDNAGAMAATQPQPPSLRRGSL